MGQILSGLESCFIRALFDDYTHTCMCVSVCLCVSLRMFCPKRVERVIG